MKNKKRRWLMINILMKKLTSINLYTPSDKYNFLYYIIKYNLIY